MGKRTIDWGTNEDFINNYYKLKSSRKMGELYNCTKTSILKHAYDIGFNTKDVQTPKLSEQDKQAIREAYYTDKTSTELAEEYNVSRGMITKVWYDANLSGKQRTYENTTKIDLTGQTFGYLTVLHETDKRASNGNIVWHCFCNRCGNEADIAGAILRDGRAISCGCVSRDNLLLGRGLRPEQDKTGKRFGSLTVLKRIDNKILNDGKSYVQYLCQCDCGNQVEVLSSNLGSGNTQSCGKCSNKSHGNTKIDILLSEAEIPFVREKRFPDCKDLAMLPFDFYVDNSYLIEYDGRQHFYENELFNYENTHKHDLIKSNWCKEHSIPLIRIPYTHYDDLNLEDLLLETSSFIEKI